LTGRRLRAASFFGSEVALAAITLSPASQLPWIARNHPYGHAYLHVAGRPFGARFDRDYWRLSQKQLLEWSAGHERSKENHLPVGGFEEIHASGWTGTSSVPYTSQVPRRRLPRRPRSMSLSNT
jgi:hypothetical protein